MRRKKMYSIQLSAFMLGAALSATWPAAAQDAKQPYPSMAPVEQYLMDFATQKSPWPAAPLQTPSPTTPQSSS